MRAALLTDNANIVITPLTFTLLLIADKNQLREDQETRNGEMYMNDSCGRSSLKTESPPDPHHV